MDLLKQTKQLCKLHNIKPARAKGQNFLINEEIYNTIVEVADLKKDDVVLEVGPGLGFLTEKLAGKVKKVIAVELDDKLVEILRVRLDEHGIRNVEVVNEDILRFKISDFRFKISEYKIVANLPYNITSIFLRKFLSGGNEKRTQREARQSKAVRTRSWSAEYLSRSRTGYTPFGSASRPLLMVLMLQKEVAERICAKPGKMSLLAVSVQFYAEPKIIEIVPADNFWPKPEVDSAIIHLTPQPPLLNRRGGERRRGEKDFFRLVKIGFSAKRKMLKNNLANGYQISQQEAEKRLKKANFSAKIRAQELSVKDWVRLLKNLGKVCYNGVS